MSKGPIEYDHIEPLAFGGTLPDAPTFDTAKAVILPVPLESTTSYVSGTRNGPREILVASSHMELWDEELNTDIHPIGIFTLPEMELPFDDMADMMADIRRVTSAILEHDKFPVFLGGEHSLTGPIVAAMAAKHPGVSVLQIDAHADLRDTYLGTPFSHACAMRRVLEHARCTQVGIRSMSTEEAKAVPTLATTIFYDVSMRQETNWIERVVQSLGEKVYITIDVDGLDPAIMPATGTPEPGGLSWYEMLSLLRAVITARNVVGCDLVELSPLPGVIAPNFLCAKLIYKILTYQFSR
ncbi:MAG TPA: agmatinase [Vicinamibacterales bacterium]|nr:agmatinase [Vicinamibacterales bacterium]